MAAMTSLDVLDASERPAVGQAIRQAGMLDSPPVLAVTAGTFLRSIPPGRGFLLRWGVRLAVLILVAFQWVPVAGGLALPAMALINYGAYRTAYKKLATGA